MQSTGSFTLVGGLVGLVALAVALGVIIGAPIVAVPFFVIGIGAFLLWRGKRRAADSTSAGYWADRRRVPGTEETGGDPVRDSGVAEATTSGTVRGHRRDAPRV